MKYSRKMVILVEHANKMTPGIEVMQLFPCPTQLNMPFILLINFKMLTIVSRINPSESSKTF